jgi:methionyl aminopeptidase
MGIPIKNSYECDKMRVACRIASEVLERTGALIQPGITTGEVDRAAASFIREAGGQSAFLNYRGFTGNICISVNEEVVHGIGGPRRIQYGDIVKLDIGVVHNGWVGDTATTIPVGAIDPSVMRLLQVTEDALALGITYATDGRRLGDMVHDTEDE